METFEYFKVIAENLLKNNNAEPNEDECSLDLYGNSLLKIKNYNFIKDFAPSMLNDLEIAIEELLVNKHLQFKKINSVSAGFMTDYCGLAYFDPAILVNVSYEKGDKQKSVSFLFTRFEVASANKYNIVKNDALTKFWRDYLGKKYKTPYRKALSNYVYRQNHINDTEPVGFGWEKINLIVNYLN